MKKFHSKLDELYEGLHLKKTYTEESKRPNFKIEDFILASVYDHIDKNILGFDWDFSDKEIVGDLIGQFRQIKDMIERTYTELNKEDTEERPRATLTPPGIPQKDIGGKGTFEISVDQSTLIVSIDDVEDRIDIGKLNDLKTGKPIDIDSTAGMIRIRARLEALLRKMGYDVGGPFVPDNEYEVKVNHNNKTFKLVRKPGR